VRSGERRKFRMRPFFILILKPYLAPRPALPRVAASHGVSLWLTETNSAYEASSNIIPTFVNGFWYINSLGQYAQTGVSAHCRWSFFGCVQRG
jgi:hypothetical protein